MLGVKYFCYAFLNKLLERAKKVKLLPQKSCTLTFAGVNGI